METYKNGEMSGKINIRIKENKQILFVNIAKPFKQRWTMTLKLSVSVHKNIWERGLNLWSLL